MFLNNISGFSLTSPTQNATYSVFYDMPSPAPKYISAIRFDPIPYFNLPTATLRLVYSLILLFTILMFIATAAAFYCGVYNLLCVPCHYTTEINHERNNCA